jgi:uncharacterized coiled-coil DUF342 family protein
MIKEFKELLMKKAKEGKHADPERIKAGSDVLKELGDMLKDRIKGNLKKVTVASDSPEGLKKGLEKAEDMLDESHGGEEIEKEAEEEMEGDSGEYSSKHEESESSDKEIAELEKKIAELKSKKKV